MDMLSQEDQTHVKDDQAKGEWGDSCENADMNEFASSWLHKRNAIRGPWQHQMAKRIKQPSQQTSQRDQS